jgi:tight adherence protein C
MQAWGVFLEFIDSFGISFGVVVDYARFAPFAIMAIAIVSFFYSNIQRMQEEARERMAERLRHAGTTGNRGLTAAELAQRIAPDNKEEGARKTLVNIAEIILKIAKFDRKETERKLIQSGDRDPRAISRYILQRGTAMAVAPIFGWLVLPALGMGGMMQVAGSLICVLAGGILVDIRLDKALKKRREAVASEFPVLMDLLTIYLEAGQAFDVALARASVALGVSFPTAAEEVGFLRQDLEMSVDRERTLREFGQRLNNGSASTFVSIVIQAERRGNAIAPALRTLAKESRKEVMQDIEKKAQKLPTLMQGPMFIMILPAIFLSVIGPAIVQIMIQFDL